MKRFKAIDAFCGAGGLSLGLQNAGFDIQLSFDIDELCIETLKKNPQYHQHLTLACDVKQMLNNQWSQYTKLKKGTLDLLAGGPPCQGFSVQRTVGDDQDQRNLLIDDYGDLVLELMPKFFLLENVTGIGGKRGRAILAKFKDKICAAGYFCHEQILDAQNYQVPQRRKRYILVGEQLSGNNPRFKWPAQSSVLPPTVRDTISGLPKAPLTGKPHDEIPLHRADKLSEKNLARIGAIKSGQSRQHLPQHLLADCHKLSADKIGHRNVYGRMAWDSVAPTITAKFDSFTRGQFGHPEQNRSISLLEGALLQTFPKDYCFLGNKVQIARQIGNAVPPLMAQRLCEAIIAALDSK